jgi:hypothetical protein
VCDQRLGLTAVVNSSVTITVIEKSTAMPLEI